MVKTQNRFHNLENKRIGRLLILNRDWEKTKKENGWKVYWTCQCDCGTIVSVRAEHLKSSGKQHTQSCGCLQKEKASINGKKINYRLESTHIDVYFKTIKKEQNRKR